MMKDRILNRQTAWNLINIKARRQQTSEHYVNALIKLYADDPLVDFPYGGKTASLKYLRKSELLEKDGMPQWLELGLLSYTIIDPTAFYNKKSQEDIRFDNWNDDIVANKKEVMLYFFPAIHMIAVKYNSPITLKSIVFYLQESLNRIEKEMFDVDVIVERNMLDKILNAYSIVRLYANISYSNPGFTDEFIAAFDSKLKETAADKIEMTLSGTKNIPLKREKDGVIEALVNLSERNGSLEATIQETENSRLETIKTKNYPCKLILPQIINSIPTTLLNYLKTIYGK